jgi:hypothetical protein
MTRICPRSAQTRAAKLAAKHFFSFLSIDSKRVFTSSNFSNQALPVLLDHCKAVGIFVAIICIRTPKKI